MFGLVGEAAVLQLRVLLQQPRDAGSPPLVDHRLGGRRLTGRRRPTVLKSQSFDAASTLDWDGSRLEQVDFLEAIVQVGDVSELHGAHAGGLGGGAVGRFVVDEGDVVAVVSDRRRQTSEGSR